MQEEKENFSSLTGPRIADERARLGLTQDQAGEKCGVSREMWGKYERGKAAMGTEVLSRFARAGADALYVLTGEREYRQTESQDQFISRMQVINATGRVVDALPLPEREREGLKLCLTGDPVQDGRAIAEALKAALLAQGSKSVVTSAQAPEQIQYVRGTVVPMPTNENAGLTQQEVMALVLDALHEAKRTLPAARIFAVVDAVMAWQRAGMNVTESSVVEQLRQVK